MLQKSQSTRPKTNPSPKKMGLIHIVLTIILPSKKHMKFLGHISKVAPHHIYVFRMQSCDVCVLFDVGFTWCSGWVQGRGCWSFWQMESSPQLTKLTSRLPPSDLPIGSMYGIFPYDGWGIFFRYPNMATLRENSLTVKLLVGYMRSCLCYM